MMKIKSRLLELKLYGTKELISFENAVLPLAYKERGESAIASKLAFSYSRIW